MSSPHTPVPSLSIPSGSGLRPKNVSALRGASLKDLFDLLLIWEPPDRKYRYVVSADVSDGVGRDRSVADVTRVGDVSRPDEQVAQWISATTDPVAFAGVLDTIGRFYTGSDELEALMAIETNAHGLVTQSELQRHYGYTNFFVWQREDAGDPARRFSQAIGWVTTRRTRPMILARYVRALRVVDPVTGFSDLIVNSPHTLEELADFYTEGLLLEAEAAPGAYDDCIMTGAIGLHVAQTLLYEFGEPLAEKRRRLSEEQQRRQDSADQRGRRTYASMPYTLEEISQGIEPDEIYDDHPLEGEETAWSR